MHRTLFLIVFVRLTLCGPVWAQPTNVEALGSLAVKCLGSVPGTVDAFRLRTGNRMPYLRPFLTKYWLLEGYTVFVADSTKGTPDRPLHELRYEPLSANVSFERGHSDSLERSVTLSISHSFISPDGLLVDENHCRESFTDSVPSSEVTRLQMDPWEEARGSVPLDRSWRTWAEPAAIGTSIAVVVYLFFSVRS